MTLTEIRSIALVVLATMCACGDAQENKGSAELDIVQVQSSPVACSTDDLTIEMGSICRSVANIECDDKGQCRKEFSSGLGFYVGTAPFLGGKWSEELGDADESNKCELVKSYLANKGLSYHGPPVKNLSSDGDSEPNVGDRIRYGFGVHISFDARELKSFAATDMEAMQGLPLEMRDGGAKGFVNGGELDSSNEMLNDILGGLFSATISCDTPFLLNTNALGLWHPLVDGGTPNPFICKESFGRYICKKLAVDPPAQQSCKIDMRGVRVIDGSGKEVTFDLSGLLERAPGQDGRSEGYILRDIALTVQ